MDGRITLVALAWIAMFVVLPCIIGTAVYYFAVKAVVGVRWLTMDEPQRDLARRRQQIRVRD